MGAEVVGGLRATPRAAGSVRSGHDGRGTVIVTNTSGVTVSLSAGTPYAAVLLKSGTDAVVGVYDSEIAGVGSGATLRSGEHLTVSRHIEASAGLALGARCTGHESLRPRALLGHLVVGVHEQAALERQTATPDAGGQVLTHAL